MKHWILFFMVGSLFILLQSCKSDSAPCCQGYNLNVVTHWTGLEEGRTKPSAMSAIIYSTEDPDYLRSALHPDGGSIYSDFEQNDLLLYNIQEGQKVTFQNLNEYAKAAALLIPYEEESELFIPEPYLLYGESFSNLIFSDTSTKTLHCTPVALTNLIRLEVTTMGEGVENIQLCEGKLSGLSSRIYLAGKSIEQKGYPVRFTTVRTTTNYIKELLHFGYVDQNVLELSFTFTDGEKKSIALDLTETLAAVARKDLTCRLTVVFTSSGIQLEVKDVTIEPYKIGDTEFIDIT